jgi:hypothetical protein
MGCTTQDSSLDQKAEMSWYISPASGMIQLNPLLPLEVVYAEDHGSGTVGGLWDEHHEAFAAFVNKYNVGSVLEIGGLHGHLAKKCLNANSKLDWTIIEPNPRVDESIRATVIRGWFDETFDPGRQYGAIVHSHVMEHLYDPQQFMRNKAAFMQEDSLVIFSVPNIKRMLENKYTNCLNFEHTYYASEDFVTQLLEEHKFELIEREYFKDDHSIFFCARRTNNNNSLIKKNLYSETKATFQQYIDYHLQLVDSLNLAIRETGQPVYLFGAHIFAQYLLQFGLDESKIVCILDNDPLKQGKRLYGTSLVVESPQILKQTQAPLVILKAGFYNNEIKNQILTTINSNAIFL